MVPSKKNINSRHGPSTNLPRLAESVDVTDETVAAENPGFHVDDRVERLLGNSEEERWGTITARAAGAGPNWLVVDNDGVTHRDNATELSLAIPSGGKRAKERRT